MARIPIPPLRNRSKPASKGITLIELIVVVAMSGVLIFGMVRLFSPILKFFQRTQARQLINSEARVCLNTLKRVISDGKISTLNVSMTVTSPPSSQAQFYTLDGTFYTLLWNGPPANTLILQQTSAGGILTTSTLSTHVSELIFTLDTNDPGLVHVTLGLAYPLDSSGAPGSVVTILLPNQSILMHT